MHEFKDFLKHENLSKNTIDSYQSSVDHTIRSQKTTYFPSRLSWLTAIKEKQLTLDFRE